jgi:hypothetical protein
MASSIAAMPLRGRRVSRSTATQAPFAALGILLLSIAAWTGGAGWLALLVAASAAVLLTWAIFHLLRHR